MKIHLPFNEIQQSRCSKSENNDGMSPCGTESSKDQKKNLPLFQGWMGLLKFPALPSRLLPFVCPPFSVVEVMTSMFYTDVSNMSTGCSFLAQALVIQTVVSLALEGTVVSLSCLDLTSYGWIPQPNYETLS